MKSKTEYISKLIRNSISSIDPKAEVILYGSRARGDERTNSDWDILILQTIQLTYRKKENSETNFMN